MTFWILSFKLFSQLDRLGWISHRFTRLHANRICAHVSVCLCVAVRSGRLRLSLVVMSDIVTWLLELYYSWDQCWDSTRPDTVEPVPPEALPLSPFILPPRHFSEDYFPFTFLFSAEIELWELWTWKLRVFTSRDDSQWQTARGGHCCQTPNNDQGRVVKLCPTIPKLHLLVTQTLFPTRGDSKVNSKLRFWTCMNHHCYASLRCSVA